jgi:interferon gamma-inducible protein 30
MYKYTSELRADELGTSLIIHFHFADNVLAVGMYPYGNAREIQLPDGQYSFKCQHGQPECVGNLIEACLQKLTNFNPFYYLPVLECMESAKDPVSAAPECLELFIPNSSWDTVQKCAKVV